MNLCFEGGSDEATRTGAELATARDRDGATKGGKVAVWSRDLAVADEAMPGWMIEMAGMLRLIGPETAGLPRGVIVGSAVIERNKRDKSNSSERYNWTCPVVCPRRRPAHGCTCSSARRRTPSQTLISDASWSVSTGLAM